MVSRRGAEHTEKLDRINRMNGMQKNEMLADVDVGIITHQTSKLVHRLSSPHIVPSLKQWHFPAGDPERAQNLNRQDQEDFVDGRSKHRRGSPVCSHCASIESPRTRGF